MPKRVIKDKVLVAKKSKPDTPPPTPILPVEMLSSDEEEVTTEPETEPKQVVARAADTLSKDLSCEYSRLYDALNTPEFSCLSESQALDNFIATPKNRFCFESINVLMTNILVWVISPVFKNRTQFFPHPFIADSFDKNFSISSLSNWCFYDGSRTRCLHRGCARIFDLFNKASIEGFFYRALWTSFSRNIPKTSITSILNKEHINATFDVYQDKTGDYLLVPYVGLVYYGYDKTNVPSAIQLYQACINEGTTIFPFLNRRTNCFKSDLSLRDYPPNTISYALDNNGNISINSATSICDDIRLSACLYNRKYNYHAQLVANETQFMCSYSIVAYKDCIHINRTQAASLIDNAIILYGGTPISSVYTSPTAEDDLHRDFYFIVTDFKQFTLVKDLYQSILKSLTYLDVDFNYNIPFVTKKPIAKISLITSTEPELTYNQLTPIILSPNYFKYTSVNQINYVVIKPTGYSLDRLSAILSTLVKFRIRLIAGFSRRITDNEFNTLYPCCMKRVYGPDWYCHMTSGPCLFLKLKGSIPQIRNAAWAARSQSGLPWVKNVIHSAAKESEREQMHLLFGSLFDTELDAKDVKFSVLI